MPSSLFSPFDAIQPSQILSQYSEWIYFTLILVFFISISGIALRKHFDKPYVKPRSPKKFILPGLMKIEVKRKPATKVRKGRNPFTGEEMMLKAKPARDIVKIRPLKKVKEMVG